MYQSDKSLVHQRQLNEDTRSFANALRAALREDPDVILVGERSGDHSTGGECRRNRTSRLRNPAHSSAAQTVDRMVDVFPPEQQTQIRVQLSGSLVAVFSQTLAGAGDGPGDPDQHTRHRQPDPRGPTAQLYSQIQTGGEQGMQTLEKALAAWLRIAALDRCRWGSHCARFRQGGRHRQPDPREGKQPSSIPKWRNSMWPKRDRANCSA